MKTVSDYLYSKASSMKIPLGGTFELSPVCNFACKMCYVRKTPQDIAREGKSLKTWQQWLELGRQCRDAGMLYLLLTGGEPFLYPNFRELYTALHEMGLIISINTNGTMIDEQTVAWLKEKAPQRVNITLYGASEDTYERICGQRSGYRRACRAIDLLRQAGIPVVINASMIPENQADLEEIIQFGKSRSLNTRVATYMFPPARREGEESDSRFTPQQCAQVFLRKAKAMQTPQDYARWLENQRAQHNGGGGGEPFQANGQGINDHADQHGAGDSQNAPALFLLGADLVQILFGIQNGRPPLDGRASASIMTQTAPKVKGANGAPQRSASAKPCKSTC